LETLPVLYKERIQPTELVPAETWLRPRRRRASAGLVFLATAFFTIFVLKAFSPIFILFAVMALVVIISRVRVEDARAVEANQDAIALLNDGRFDEASQAFEGLAQTYNKTNGHAVYVFNTGVAFMLQGKLRRAFAVFNSVLISKRFAYGAHGNHEALLLAEMAACAALLGWKEDADKFRRRAAKKLKGDEVTRLSVADVIIALRGGAPKAALEIMRRNGPTAEDVLRPPSVRALLIMRAFALEELKAHREADDAVRNVMPIRPGEFDWLGQNWPEMRNFLSNIRQ
jgi:tetratricopeptide (TPR) repeat protein